MKSLKLLTAATISACAFLGLNAQAEMFEVTITNTTAAQLITPPVVLTHNSHAMLFTLGEAAPDYLVPLAEDGDASAFADADSLNDVSNVALADGPIMPGHSLTLMVETTTEHPLLSVAGMFASSNDAFVALNGVSLDFNAHSQKYYAHVYDAGSEANSEDCQYIPGPPCGNGGVRDTEGAEGFVHIHSGIHGIKDLSASQYSWQNPGALVTVKMK